jgi:hypothetical protein
MSNKHMPIWDELELGLGGGSKFRVVRELLQKPNEVFTKYALVKATGLRTPSVESQLKALLKLGWIKEYAFTPKTYQVNLKNEVVQQLFEVFQKIRHVKAGS